MKLRIITPDTMLLDTEVNKINISQKEGGFSILNRHSPLISAVNQFVLTIDGVDAEHTFLAGGSGTLKVNNEGTTLLLDYGVFGNSKANALANLETYREAKKASQNAQGAQAMAAIELELIRLIQS